MAQSAIEAIDACSAKPSGPRNAWLAYAALYRDPLGYLTRAARKHGDVVHIKIGRKSDFLLNHPDLIRAALLDHENLRRCVHRPLRRVLGTVTDEKIRDQIMTFFMAAMKRLRQP